MPSVTSIQVLSDKPVDYGFKGPRPHCVSTFTHSKGIYPISFAFADHFIRELFIPYDPVGNALTPPAGGHCTTNLPVEASILAIIAG